MRTPWHAAPSAIRVVLADDHPLVRSGIRATLSDAADIALVAEASDAHEVLELSSTTPADVMLRDISTPGPSRADTVAALERRCDSRILLLSAYVRGAIHAGVAGYLLKDDVAAAPRRCTRGAQARPRRRRTRGVPGDKRSRHPHGGFYEAYQALLDRVFC